MTANREGDEACFNPTDTASSKPSLKETQAHLEVEIRSISSVRASGAHQIREWVWVTTFLWSARHMKTLHKRRWVLDRHGSDVAIGWCEVTKRPSQ